jgi:uncharacterized protein
MQVAALQMTFHAPESHSLKDKRQIVRSLVDQARRRFNIAISEVDAQDMHQKIVLGLAAVSNSHPHVRASLDEAARFIEEAAERLGAECISIEQVV